ncbi:MAG: hypothetical protein C0503_02870 [Gemmatimonas sp.]|nr:hypothetical protein [Gemmatimonas sp.]
MPHPGKKITELDEESVPLDASDIAVIVADVPAAPVTRKTALGTLRRFILGIATIGTVTIPEAVVVDGSVTAAGFVGNASTASAWATPRQLTIGGAGKAVNGSADVNWTLGEIGAAAAAHGHPIADISGLQAALDGKAPMAHTHPVGDLTGFGAAGGYLRSDGLAWARVAGLAWADVTGAPTTLAGYGITDGVTTARALTVAGTAGRITSSAGAQSLAADRTWTIDLATSGVGAGTYGGATTVAQITVDAYGRITSAGNVGITVDGGNITGVVGVANGGTGIGTLTANRYLRSNATGTAYEWRTAAEILTEGGASTTGHTHPFSDITLLPNSLGGYGINDAVFKATGVTDNRLVRWDGASGNYVQNSGVTIDDSNNVTGVASLTATTLTGTLATAAQPNVTSVGTLTSLTVAGSISAGAAIESTGTTAALTVKDRTNSANSSALYRTGGITRLWASDYGDVITYSNAGNVGIGTTPSAKLHVLASASGGAVARLQNSDVSGFTGIEYLDAAGNTDLYIGLEEGGGAARYNSLDGGHRFYVSSTERARITEYGYLKVSDTGTYANVAGVFHELRAASANDVALFLDNTSATNPYGMVMRFTATAPNNTTSYFLRGEDNLAARFSVYSNGTIQNSTGIYGRLDDTDSYFQLPGGDVAYVVTGGAVRATFNASGITAYDFILSSDLTLKRHPTPIINARGVVRTVPGLRYWHIEHRRWELGFGAQHLLATAIGDLTTMVDSRGYFGVMYERTIPVLWNAVRDQDEDLEALKREVALLRHQLTALQHQPRMAA